MIETLCHQASYRGDASEDRAMVLAIGEARIIAVADGVGGRPNGGIAAERAVQAVGEVAAQMVRRDGQAWYRLLRAIDDALAAEEDAGETTLVALCVAPGRIVGASVGDSEAWWITAEGHFDLTAKQQRKPFLGTGAARPIPFEMRIERPGTLLVATDGLFKYADVVPIGDAVRGAESLEGAAVALQTLAAGPAGRLYDDLALVLARPQTAAPLAGWRRVFRRRKSP